MSLRIPRTAATWQRFVIGLPALAAALALLAGCAAPWVDGPDANPPHGLESVPNAVPRIEPLRAGGPNRPYEAAGRRYVPLASDVPFNENGVASWYGRKFHGRPTSSGEPYDMYAMTAAHKTLPIPSYVRVRNPANGREVIVRVNDRGPFVDGRIIDLSYTAALKLGLLAGVARVEMRRIMHDEIRAGPTTSASSVAGASPMGVGDPAPHPGLAGPVPAGFWLQLAALKDAAAGAALRRRLLADADLPGVHLLEAAGLTRVQVGPYRTRADAAAAHRSLAARLELPAAAEPLIVERR